MNAKQTKVAKAALKNLAGEMIKRVQELQNDLKIAGNPGGAKAAGIAVKDLKASLKNHLAGLEYFFHDEGV